MRQSLKQLLAATGGALGTMAAASTVLAHVVVIPVNPTPRQPEHGNSTRCACHANAQIRQ
ncbi:hypothetical protein GCM10025858_14310 [Alicyclobacillus sacchari]|nr:hypothetical protein GCM10025858_14310 [Alicyclobacillus sacchari]